MPVRATTTLEGVEEVEAEWGPEHITQLSSSLPAGTSQHWSTAFLQPQAVARGVVVVASPSPKAFRFKEHRVLYSP